MICVLAEWNSQAVGMRPPLQLQTNGASEGLLKMSAEEFWGAVAVFVVLMWTLAFWIRKRRAAALRTVADELNLDYEQVSDVIRALEDDGKIAKA